MFETKVKVLVRKDGQFLLSDGRAEILRTLDECHSISGTARRMHMSYRYLWGVLKKMEERMGMPLISSTHGGVKGGMTRLTQAGRELLEYYDLRKDFIEKDARYGPRPYLTVDGILIKKGQILLIQRKNDPFKGRWALPGGFVEHNETVEEAVIREIAEETSLRTSIKGLFGVYSDPKRDPRGHTVSVVFVLKQIGGRLKAGDDASNGQFFPLDKLPRLAFDHENILSDLCAKTKLKVK
jgi:8-oxo-dGTP diphosphatase